MDKTIHLLIMYTMLVLMLILLRKGKHDTKSFYLIIYAFVEVITNGMDSLSLWTDSGIYEKLPAIHFVLKPVTLLWVPLFFFYIKSCLSKQFKLSIGQLLNLLPFIIAIILFLFLRITKGSQSIVENMFNLRSIEGFSLYIIDIFIRLQYIIYNTLLIIELIKIENKLKQKQIGFDLKVNNHWLRFIVYGYAFACSGALISFIMFHINWTIASKINLYSVLIFFIYFFIIFYDTIASKNTNSTKTPKPNPLQYSELHIILHRLKHLFNETPMYLDANLTLKQVAEALGEKERSISQAINIIEQRIFKDYINEMRINNAVKQLNTEKNKAIFEVMFDSGFNTKAPFNSAFKKFTGKTPTEYRIHNK